MEDKIVDVKMPGAMPFTSFAARICNAKVSRTEIRSVFFFIIIASFLIIAALYFKQICIFAI